jgi:transposase
METLVMSIKERRRLVVLAQVAAGRLTVASAAGLLGLSERQTRRVWKRYRPQGAAGLGHRLRGRAGNRRIEASVQRWAVELYRRHYGDFGPTLAAEYLGERHGLVVDDQTLRRWLMRGGLWQRRRKSRPKRHRRPRRMCFGELVQLDGSPHDWFEGRAGRALQECCLMVMVDDATGWTAARFFPAETTHAVMSIFRDWTRAHGLPRALYPDRHSIHRRNDPQADEIYARTGQWPPTQFGRALAELGWS